MSRLRPQFCLNYLFATAKKSRALSSSRRKLNRHSAPRQLLKAAVLWAFVAGGIAVAPKSALATVRQVCYAVGDNGGNGDPDFLIQIDDAGNPTDIGATGTTGIEAAAVNPLTGEFFVANDTGGGSILGTLNLATGAFTARPGATAVAGDIDGLSFTPTGQLFASTRVTAGQDQLFELDPANGSVIGGPTNIDTSGLAGLDDIDGITFDSTGNTLFGIANGSSTSDQRLVQIDPNTGAVTDIGTFTDGGALIEDVEDLTFDRNGVLRATTGNGLGDDDDELFTVDPLTGNSTPIGGGINTANAVDFEASDCTRLPAIDLALGKSVSPTSAAPGDTVTFTIAVQNGFVAAGSTPAPNNSNLDSAADNANLDPANNVTITDVLPTGLTISTTTVPVASQGTFDSNTGIWTLGTINPGDRQTLTITATVDAGTAAGTLTNFAEITTDRVPGGIADITFFPGTSDPYDIDSDPGNDTGNTPDEDDEATASLTVTAPTGVNVGDFVFEDLDGDGIQDPGEPGIEGVELALLNAADSTPVTGIANVTSAATTGAYLFPNVPPGDYIIRAVTLPAAGFVPTLADQGAGATQDEDDSDLTTVSTDFQTAPFTVAATDDLTRDLGFVRPATVGDFVFTDVDNNNVFSAGDTVVQGVTVALTAPDGSTVQDLSGTDVANVVTNATGNYSFTNLRPGTYKLTFSGGSTANGFVTPLTGGDPAIDSNVVNTGADAGMILNIVLDSNETDNSLDAGIQPSTAIGDVVFQDTNRNGIQEMGEDGVAGAVVTLIDAGTGNPVAGVAPITTVADGAYLFNNLPAGDYRVRFDISGINGANFTTANATGSNEANDSDAETLISAGVFETANITLANGVTNLDVDAGVIGARLGDFVFLDSNANGIQDGGGESGVTGVTATLQNAGGGAVTDIFGNAVAPTSTNGAGLYTFDNLPPGSYEVVFDASATGFSFTTQNSTVAGSTDANDSDVNPANSTSDAITLAAGEENLTLDAGLIGNGLGNFVFIDSNGNGLQDQGEPGAAGVTVTLQDSNGNPVNDASGSPVGPITTGADGAYNFTNLAPNNYQILFDANATGLTFITPNAGDDTLDSDVVPDAGSRTGSITGITLGAGASDFTLDAGLRGATIGDRVFNDVNANGIQDAGDTNAPGVTVSLQAPGGGTVNDASGNPVDSTTTDPNGNYSFENLAPGDYQVVFSGVTLIQQGVGADPAVDSNPDPATGVTPTITLAPGQTEDLTIDAGVSVGASLGSLVFVDSNANGIQDPSESGQAGVIVSLEDPNGNPVTDLSGNPVQPITTGADGVYNFTNLAPGSYQVRFDTGNSGLVFSDQNVGADTTIDSDVDPNTGLITGITLAAGQNQPDFDAGVRPPGASLGSLVFVDSNANGIQDLGETGQAGVIVSLEDENGNPVTDISGNPVQPITTGADGVYNFTNLAPGNYQVRFDTGTSGLVFSDPNQGTNDDVDSDVDPNTGLITGITLAAGQNQPNFDAGVRPAPQLTVVKRITAVRRNGTPLALPVNFNGVELDNPSLGTAPLTATTLTQFETAGLSPIGIQQLSDSLSLLPGDEVQYTLYFLSNGAGTVGNAEVCDVLPARLDFNEAGGITLSDASDSAQFLAPLTPFSATGAGRSCNGDDASNQGAVVAELGDLAINAVGSVTFSAFIDGEQTVTTP